MEPKAWLCEWPGSDGETYVRPYANELDALDQKKRRPDTVITPLYSLDGISQDAIDGGWSIKGLSDYAKRLENRPFIYLGRIDRPEGGEAWVELDEIEHKSWPDTVRVMCSAIRAGE